MKHYFKYKAEKEAGCDEAGRGCLAGPVVAAAVVLPAHFEHPLLNDSKKMSPEARNKCREFIELNALDWAVAFVEAEQIDQINILQASFLAMHMALNKLKTQPKLALIDGNRFNKHPKIEHVCLVKGDAHYLSIAAASVLAKTHRDEFMCNAHSQFPHYNWIKNKGYPTADHRNAIAQFGPSSLHRLSFTLLPKQLSLDF